MRFTKKALKRRLLLKGMLAGSAIYFPIPRLAQQLNSEGLAWADGSELPRRFGLWFFGNGNEPATWHPSGNGGQGDSWSLTEQLQPLAEFKSHLTVISKMELYGADIHYGGSACATTGTPPTDSGSPRLASIDQRIANENIANQTSPFKSIQVGLSKATPSGPEPTLFTISHAAADVPIYPEYNPHNVFARLFGVAATTPELREAQRSVLDAVLEDLNALNARLSAEDRIRIEAHADGVRALEKRLLSAPKSCGLIRELDPSLREDYREEAPIELNEIMGQMLTTAMACDVTNVWSYCWTLPAGQVYYRHMGDDFQGSFHEDIVHLTGGKDGIPNGRALIRKGVQFAMQSFASHLKLLQQTTTPTGSTLLDEICIYCTSEVSSGWDHKHDNHPIIIAGKACGKLKGDLHWTANGMQNHNRVMLTLANLMGVQTDYYGLGSTRSNNPINDILA